jgi:ketosteroid isomerase-like protein
MSDAFAVGKKLVELCRQGKNMEAIDTLYSDDVVSLEVDGGPGMPARIEGLAAVKGKSEWWIANHEVHSSEVDGPYPRGDQFIVVFKLDVTAKGGPMAGKSFSMQEAGLYTVKDGKVAQEEFFYSIG